MVWGGITAHSRTPLVVIPGNLSGIRYRDEIVLPYVKQNWTDCGTSCPDVMFTKFIATVLELIGLNPGMLLALRFDVWNRFRRCTSLMWLSRRRDVTRGRLPLHIRKTVLFE
jgi:hypothetical protein